MQKSIFMLSILLTFSLFSFAQADKIVGKWKTIDDKDGSVKSIVYIFKASNGKFFGKVEKLFKNPEKLCSECEGINKNKPVVGMQIINDLIEKEGKLTGGTILDPKTGKIYKCNISLDPTGEKLIVRGSLDKNGWIGRSQTWIRIQQ
jgi:Uncharacterized protein conserved in bacteria